MRGKTRNRRRKYRINYRRIVLLLLVLALIILASTFGIKTILNEAQGENFGSQGGTSIQEEPKVPDDITIDFVAIGDVMCHSTNFKAAYNSETKEYDFSKVFTNVAKYITSADIAIRKFGNNICRRR